MSLPLPTTATTATALAAALTCGLLLPALALADDDLTPLPTTPAGTGPDASEDALPPEATEPGEPSSAGATEPPASPAPAGAAPSAEPPLEARLHVPTAGEELGDQILGGAIGLAAGGRVTPGGLRVSGHYLYQLSDSDWFDGIASFTFGGGAAACFRDRSDRVICDHGLASGGSIELAAGVRRYFTAQGRFRPFARAAIGLMFVRYAADDVSGIAIPLHAGAGLRARLTPSVGLVALADASLGLGRFGRGLGGEPLFGLAISAGIEFRLR